MFTFNHKEVRDKIPQRLGFLAIEMMEGFKVKTAPISEISILVIQMKPSIKTILGNSFWNTNFKYIQNLQNLLKS